MNPDVKFAENYGGGVLACPECGEAYLHSGAVETWDRKEDGETGTHGTLDTGRAKLDTDMARNPSSRRGGIIIHFACENCGHFDGSGALLYPLHLAITQHKGNTILEWVD